MEPCGCEMKNPHPFFFVLDEKIDENAFSDLLASGISKETRFPTKGRKTHIENAFSNLLGPGKSTKRVFRTLVSKKSTKTCLREKRNTKNWNMTKGTKSIKTNPVLLFPTNFSVPTYFPAPRDTHALYRITNTQRHALLLLCLSTANLCLTLCPRSTHKVCLV
jgi:hypothetical protein